MQTQRRLRAHHFALGLIAVLLFLAAGPLHVWRAHGDRLGARSVQLSNSLASATANYILSFTGQTAGTVGSIRLQFCANDPLIGLPCTAPSGFDLSGASLSDQTGMTGFAIDAADSTANVLVLGRTAGPSIASASTYTLSGVVNPDTEGSYYVRLETYATSDASGPHSDYGGLAFAITGAINISTYVPPYLLFCTGVTIQPYDCSTANGNYINFGEFTPGTTATGQTQLLVATNAADGYSIRVNGTTLTSGNNTIPPLATSDVSRRGVSQFGLNLRANGTPPVGSDPQGDGAGTPAPDYNAPDFFRYNNGEVVAGALTSDSYRLYTASYIVNISTQQPPGIYVSTISYVALANF